MVWICKECKKKGKDVKGLWLDMVYHFRKEGSVHSDLWTKSKHANHVDMNQRMTFSDITDHVEFVKNDIHHESDDSLEDDFPPETDEDGTKIKLPEDAKDEKEFIEKHKKR